ncbi:MAG TPA: hypothetical protein DF480_04790 [Clostridiales bacterium]|nr:hypothetical protein [Clostridiales bacterium]
MHQFSYMLPPLLGCLVGYITNSLAVKMLFHPYRSIRIWKFHVPFTPGMIPKRQKELSTAMGKMVQGHLLTKEAIQKRLLSPDVKSAVIAEISSGVFTAIQGKTIYDTAEAVSGAPEAERLKEHLAGWISERILLECHQVDFHQVLAREVKPFLDNNLGGIAALFVNDKTIDLLTRAAADRIMDALSSDGKRFLQPLVKTEIDDLLSLPVDDALVQAGMSQDKFLLLLGRIYDRGVQQNLDEVIAAIDMAAIVENKVAEMNVRELEQLVTSIMKRELRGIVNLGGLIGLVLGGLSLLF